MDATRDAPISIAAIGADLGAGLALQQAINRQRLDRGDRPLGFKIGFTNRTIWPIYGVDAPIWAPVWSTTVHDAPTATLALPGLVGRLNRPRLEPEIVIGLRRVPGASRGARNDPDRQDDTTGPANPAVANDPANPDDLEALEDLEDLDALVNAIDWIAHGFELVQSPWPDWKFAAGQAIAAQGLHGALVVGPRRRVRDRRDLAAALSALTIALYRDDPAASEAEAGAEAAEPRARGRGSDVLDGPVQALGHWLREARRRPGLVVPLAGMMVTTGTLTDAMPVGPGEQWRTRIDDGGGRLAACLDAPLVDLTIRL